MQGLLYLVTSLAFLLDVLGKELSNIDVLTLKTCPVSSGLSLNDEIKLVEKNGKRTVSMKFKNNEEITADFTYTAKVEKLTLGQYHHFMDANGMVCKLMQDIMESAYTRFRKDISPPIEDPCIIPPGEYSIEDYQIKRDEIDLVIPMSGQFRAKYYMYNGDGEEVTCWIVEAIIK